MNSGLSEFIGQVAAVVDYRHSMADGGPPVVLNRHDRTPIMALLVNLPLFHRLSVGRFGDRQTADYSGKTRMLN